MPGARLELARLCGPVDFESVGFLAPLEKTSVFSLRFVAVGSSLYRRVANSLPIRGGFDDFTQRLDARLDVARVDILGLVAADRHEVFALPLLFGLFGDEGPAQIVDADVLQAELREDAAAQLVGEL